MRLFKIGEVVWVARQGLRPIQEPCTVCYGKKAVVVILGNGDEVTTPCSYCGAGYEPPSGVVTEYRIEPGTETVVITGREIREGESVKVTYHGCGGYCYDQDVVFETKEEALAESAKRCEKEGDERATRSAYIKKDKIKSFAWNAGYHLRAAKDYREKIAYHERMAVVCKSKAKGGEAQS